MPAHARQSKAYIKCEGSVKLQINWPTKKCLTMSLNESCEKYFKITVY